MTIEDLKKMGHDDWASPRTTDKMTAAAKIFSDPERSAEDRKQAIKVYAEITGTDSDRVEREQGLQ